MSDHPPAGPIKAPEPVYLGDGVYARFDGHGIMLMANHHETPTDKIYLEPAVLAALFKQANEWAEASHADT